MKSYFLETPPSLIGLQPGYHWLQAQYPQIQGDTLVSFIAPRSQVRFHLDPEPPKDYAALHLMVEHFDISERELRLYQRLLADTLTSHIGARFHREGIEICSGPKQISHSKTIWRPISSFYYLALPIITPGKSPEKSPEKSTEKELQPKLPSQLK